MKLDPRLSPPNGPRCQRVRWGDNKQGYKPRGGEFGSVLRQQADVARATVDLWPVIEREDTSPVCSVMASRSIRGRHVPIAQLMSALATAGRRNYYGRFARRPDASCEAMGQTSEGPGWRLGKSARHWLMAGGPAHGKTDGFRSSLPQEAESERSRRARRFYISSRTYGRISGVGPTFDLKNGDLDHRARRASLHLMAGYVPADVHAQ